MWTPPERIPTVQEMVEQASLEVAGLEQAKARLAVALRRHMLAAFHGRDHRQTNLLLIGPTGGGKTWLLRKMLQASGLPHLEVNATQYSEVGYAGLDLAQLFLGFGSERWTEGNRRRDFYRVAERWGVVILDEFDKWAFQPNLKERQPQRILQSELLRFAEGDMIRISERDGQVGSWFDTSHILFIASGAFQSLGVDPSTGKPRQLYNPADGHREITPQEVVQYGFLEELVGRFSSIITLPPLDGVAMMRIMREQLWPQYLQWFEDEGVHVDADDPSLLTVAQVAVQERLGARALGPMLDRMLWQAMSKARPGDHIHLRPEMIPLGAELQEQRP